jgi:hypothetical protein
MAFYRITIWLEDGQILQGMRELDSLNIEYATDFFRSESLKYYPGLKDIEVAMLSNQCTAVKRFIANKPFKDENKPAQSSASTPAANSKTAHGSTAFSERKMSYPPE